MYQERVVEKERMEQVAKSWLFHPGGSSCNKQAERQKINTSAMEPILTFLSSLFLPCYFLSFSLSSNERIENVQDLRP